MFTKLIEITYKGNDKWEVFVRDSICRWFEVECSNEFWLIYKVKEKMDLKCLSYKGFEFKIYRW